MTRVVALVGALAAMLALASPAKAAAPNYIFVSARRHSVPTRLKG